MIKNKGFIGIGVILAIVLGVVIIGGGAYYLGKSGSKQEVKIVETQPVKQNQPIVDNNQQTNIMTTPVSTGCTSSSTPSITVLYPNGGEVFTTGEKIDVKWSSCNVKNVYLSLISGGKDFGEITYPNPVLASDGSYKWTVTNPRKAFTNTDSNSYQLGFESQSPDVLVKSNSFTINSVTSTSTWKTYTNTEYGFSFKYPSNWETPSGTFNGKSFELYSKESITVPFITYYLSNSESIYNSFISGSWGHSIKDIPVNINISGQNAFKFTYETSLNGKGQPYPLFNQQVGFKDGKGGFFVINFAVPPTEKENGIYLFSQILSSFNIK
jgi:hypothetical protein